MPPYICPVLASPFITLKYTSVYNVDEWKKFLCKMSILINEPLINVNDIYKNHLEYGEGYGYFRNCKAF